MLASWTQGTIPPRNAALRKGHPMSDTENKVVTLTTAREAERVTGISQDLISQIIAETTRQVEARANRPSPMRLDSWEDIEAFAERAATTKMIPERFQGKPDEIIIAVMKGKEVGLPPIMALESIAVIDGRSCIYGQAVPALCWASGKCENIEEKFEGEEGTDAYTAVCIVKRRGVPTPFVGRFSVKDSKVAGLFGKRTHGAYPKRMLQWRARYALDDAFPDVLMGLATREIVEEDAAQPQWAMPKPTKNWLDRKAGKPKDGWDDTWFTGFVAKLGQEMNAWRWMERLIDGLKQAPSLRDVDEIDDLPMVQETAAKAPPEAKSVLTEAFTDARKRFADTAKVVNKAPPVEKQQTAGVSDAQRELEKALKPKAAGASDASVAPATSSLQSAKSDTVAKAAAEAPQGARDAQPQSSEQKPPAQQAAAAETAAVDFEYPLLDEWGEPLGEDAFTDPKPFIQALVARWESSGNRESLIEQNADGIADAKALGVVLDLREPAPDDADGEPQVIEAPANGTRDTWRDWLTRFRAAVATLPAAGYLPFIAANTDIIRASPTTVRPLAFKALDARADELGVPRPNTDTLKPAKLAEPTEAQKAGAADQAFDEERRAIDAESAVSTDPLAPALAAVRSDLAKCRVPAQCDALAQQPAASALGQKLRAANRQADIDELLRDFNNRKAELRAGA